MSKRGIDKRETMRRMLNATAGPDALSAMRRVAEAFVEYVNDADMTAATGAVIRVHCPAPKKTQDEDE